MCSVMSPIDSLHCSMFLMSWFVDNTENGRDLFEFPVTRTSEYSKVGKKGYLFEFDYETILFTFKNDAGINLNIFTQCKVFFKLEHFPSPDASNFHKSLGKLQLGKDLSVFTERTEDSSASQYFQFYGYLSQQQNMMQDYIRTSTYQRAILSNLDDFRVK